MPAVALVGDSVLGINGGEEDGHDPPHAPCTLTGTISGSAQSKMFLGGILVAVVGSPVSESDCCLPGTGSLAAGSSKAFVGGIPICRIGDADAPHSGSASISSGHDKMMVGG